METHARQLADTLGRQSQNLDEQLMQGISAVRRTSENITRQSVKAIEGLSGQADMLKTVSENLLTQIGSGDHALRKPGPVDHARGQCARNRQLPHRPDAAEPSPRICTDTLGRGDRHERSSSASRC